MSKQSGKIITTFQDRLEMDAALRGLGGAAGEWELRQAAREIAERYGDKLLPALLAALDTANPQMRGGLGHVARLLTRDSTVAALAAAAHNHALPDAARLAAITILERFLDAPVTDAMYAGMAAPEDLALHSLQEVIGESATDRLVLVEYFRQLELEPLDVQLTMARAARLLKGAEGVELLSMFAQSPATAVAQEALQTLGMLAEPAAVAALQGIIPSLAPGLRGQAERSLQKLRLRGVATGMAAAAPATARCLCSPVAASGHQMLLFFVPHSVDAAARYDVLEIVIQQQSGLMAAAGQRDVELDALPAALATGAWLPAQDEQPVLLEAGFDYGRRRVLHALASGWASETPAPLGYRLLGPTLWQWAKPGPGPELPEAGKLSAEDTTKLLQHPAMGGWFLRSRGIFARAEEILTGSQAPTREDFARTIQQSLQSELSSGDLTQAALAENLTAMAEWFMLAQDVEHARLAVAAAQTLEPDPASHPLLLAMSEVGLRLAMLQLARGVVL